MPGLAWNVWALRIERSGVASTSLGFVAWDVQLTLVTGGANLWHLQVSTASEPLVSSFGPLWSLKLGQLGLVNLRQLDFSICIASLSASLLALLGTKQVPITPGLL